MNMLVMPPVGAHFIEPVPVFTSGETQHLLDRRMHQYPLDLGVRGGPLDEIGMCVGPFVPVHRESVLAQYGRGFKRLTLVGR